MAMFESDGFCPANSFGHAYCAVEADGSGYPICHNEWEAICPQKAYMVYQPHRVAHAGDGEYCSIVSAILLGGKSPLGMQVACHLHAINPRPDLSGRKILIRDSFSVSEFYNVGAYDAEKYAFFENGRIDPQHPSVAQESAFLFYDDRFVVIIDNGDGNGDIVITIQKLYK